ncbi:TetR/AcrR family transcriptional regulator [Microbacterium abyssi]|uniref:TetR/AcrR family transcriptional regulator n=1 Tax=Microbacterium abyssi TaxID=2782166 RepID=UPI001887CD5B|nr:TetR/AcrR family transcriptional regulator [Microbacterium sp. A18JL241]
MVNKLRGRPRGDATARQRLLDAAHRHFEAGDPTSLSARQIAAEVGVSHTLVNYHFGSRDALIAAAVSLRAAPHQVLASARDDDGHIDLARLVHGLVRVWEHPDNGARLVEFARRLATGDERSPTLMSYLQNTVFADLAADFGQERARRMATAIIGVIFARYVLLLPSMTALTPVQVASHLLSMLR